MDPVTVSVTVAKPREEIFEYLADIANHAEFTDHYLKDWHLLRQDSYGPGAGVRFRLDAPMNRFPWGDSTIIEFQRPYRIVEAGRGGKYNRIRTLGTYTLTAEAGSTTRVEFTLETQPVMLSDRILESLGARSWIRRQNRKALRRLRSILEDGEGRGVRPTVAPG